VSLVKILLVPHAGKGSGKPRLAITLGDGVTWKRGGGRGGTVLEGLLNSDVSIWERKQGNRPYPRTGSKKIDWSMKAPGILKGPSILPRQLVRGGGKVEGMTRQGRSLCY